MINQPGFTVSLKAVLAVGGIACCSRSVGSTLVSVSALQANPFSNALIKIFGNQKIAIQNRIRI